MGKRSSYGKTISIDASRSIKVLTMNIMVGTWMKFQLVALQYRDIQFRGSFVLPINLLELWAFLSNCGEIVLSA